MSISCDMAMDLIALYKDGVASEDSRQAIREHLKGCPSCAHAFAAYSAERKAAGHPIAPRPVSEEDLTAKYRLLAKNLRRSHLISTATVLSIVAVSVVIGSLGTFRLFWQRGDDGE